MIYILKPSEVKRVLELLTGQIEKAESVDSLARVSSKYLLLRNLELYLAGQEFDSRMTTLNTEILKASARLGVLDASVGTPEQHAEEVVKEQIIARSSRIIDKPPVQAAPLADTDVVRITPEAVTLEEGKIKSCVTLKPLKQNKLNGSTKKSKKKSEKKTASSKKSSKKYKKKGRDFDDLRETAMLKECSSVWLEKEYEKITGEPSSGISSLEVIKIIVKHYDSDKSPFKNKDDRRFKEWTKADFKRGSLESLYINTTKKLLREDLSRFEMAEEILSKDSAHAFSESAKKLQETLDEKPKIEYCFPADPMPQHKDCHKIMYAGIGEFFECERCRSEDVVMCLPSKALNGQLVSSIKCQKCGNEEIYGYDGSLDSANEIRKLGKVLAEYPPFTKLPTTFNGALNRIEKDKEDSRELSEPVEPIEELQPSQLPPKEILTETVAVMPEQAVKMILEQDKEVNGPGIDQNLFAQEMEKEIKQWTEERLILKYESLTGGSMPANLDDEGRKKFLQETAVPAVTRAMANLVW